MPACNERPRSIDRVENPPEAIRRCLLIEFFAEDAIIRPLPLDDGSNCSFSVLICSGDWIEQRAFCDALIGDLDSLPEIRTNHSARCIGKLMGESNRLGIDSHGSLLLRLIDLQIRAQE